MLTYIHQKMVIEINVIEAKLRGWRVFLNLKFPKQSKVMWLTG